jgi:predicted nucleic acid-binding protein
MSIYGRPAVPDTNPLVYPDTCVYIDLITRNRDQHKDTGEQRWVIAQKLFDAVDRGAVRLAASPLIEAEVLCNGKTHERKERSEHVAKRLHTWFTSPETLWVDIDRFIAREAARLSHQYGHLREGDRTFSAADAIHLAAAIRADCDYLMTHDTGYPKQIIEGVRVQRPAVVWAETLFDS